MERYHEVRHSCHVLSEVNHVLWRDWGQLARSRRAKSSKHSVFTRQSRIRVVEERRVRAYWVQRWQISSPPLPAPRA